MNRPIFALIFPLGGGPGADNELPPGFAGYPSHGLPGGGGHPGNALPPEHGHVSPPIVIPPDAIGPGLPSLPIYLPGEGGEIDNALPGGGGHPWAPGHRPDRPSAPIVYPPGYPSNGLPATPGLPPITTNPPIVGVPPNNQIPVMPPHIGGGPAQPGSGTLPSRGERGLPEGSVLLVPVPMEANKPVQIPPGVPAGSVPVIAWKGRGSAPVVCWLPAQAAPKA